LGADRFAKLGDYHMADEAKVQFDNKREMDAAAFSQAAYVLDQAR